MTTLLAIGEVFNSATAQPTPSQWLSHQRNTGSLTTGTVTLPERNIQLVLNFPYRRPGLGGHDGGCSPEVVVAQPGISDCGGLQPPHKTASTIRSAARGH